MVWGVGCGGKGKVDDGSRIPGLGLLHHKCCGLISDV